MMKRISFNIFAKLPYIVNTVLVFTCLIHVCIIMYNDLYPKQTRSRVYKKTMSQIEFPLEFLLCVNHRNSMEKYRKVGYKSNGQFFRGFLNKTTTGWGGINANDNTSSFGTVKG